MSGSTPYEILLEINNVLCKIKHEQMCGICRSTFSNPVSATCGHVFCKVCLDTVFKHLRAVQCPICRSKLNKRSCTTSEQHDSIVKSYLQLGRAYRMSLRNSSISIPEDIAYAESQIPGTLVTSDSPMPCSGSARQFALPKLRLKRKRLYGAYINCKTPKMDRIVEENDCEENDTTPLEQDEQTMMDQPNVPDNDCKEDNAVSSQSVEVQCDAVSSQSVEVQCDAVNSQSVEVQCNLLDPAFECDDIQKSIPSLHEKYLCLSSDLRAIIEEMPRLKDLLVKNITVLYDMYGPKPCATSENHPAMDTPEKKCFSTQISFDDFPDDDDSVEVDVKPDIRPDSASSHDILQEAEEDDLKSSPSGGTARQSFDSDEITDVKDDTLNTSTPVESKTSPEEVDAEVSSDFSMEEKEDVAAHGSIVISASPISCIEDEKLVYEFVSMFPVVRFSRKTTSLCTHFIMMNSHENLCHRKSLRYVFAVAHKCEVVVRDWLEECIKSQQLLPTTEYGLTSEAIEGDPGWIRARQTDKPLFDQMSFFLPKSFSDCRLLPKESLKELITACGGSCFDKPWEIVSSENSYTIFTPYSTKVDEARKYEASMGGVPVLLADWVLESIAEYCIMPIDSYKICK